MLDPPEVPDDGLLALDAKPHSLEKYRFTWHFARQVSTAMRRKWKWRVYVDLFSGPGCARREGRDGVLIKGSPCLALDVSKPFDRYIFCEASEPFMKALQQRARRWQPEGTEVSFVQGDVNEVVGRILDRMPGGRDVLTYCFADPWKFENLAFDTLATLAEGRRVDFCVLLPTAMEGQRNIETYLKEGDVLDRFFGTSAWRDEWAKARHEGVRARPFIIEHFGRRMKELGYLWKGPEHQVKVVPRTGRPFYDLACFSKHALGLRFFKNAKTGTDPQRGFDFGEE